MTTLARKNEIQNFILANKNLDTKQIAEQLNETVAVVRANIATLKRFGRYDLTVIEFVPNEKPAKTTKKQDKKEAKPSKNTFGNVGGEMKNEARDVMEKYVTDSELSGTVLTLPWIECKMEKLLLSKGNKLNFIGYECEKDTFKQMRKTIKNESLPIVPKFGYIQDGIYGVEPNTYAHLVLDYCGSLPTIEKEIRYAVQNNIVKIGGIIAVTFGKPIRNSKETGINVKKLGYTISNNENDTRCFSDRAVEAYFHKICGFDYEFVEIFNYQDTYPMTLVILKRNR